MVVFPTASSPTIKILIPFLANSILTIHEIARPICVSYPSHSHKWSRKCTLKIRKRSCNIIKLEVTELCLVEIFSCRFNSSNMFHGSIIILDWRWESKRPSWNKGDSYSLYFCFFFYFVFWLSFADSKTESYDKCTSFFSQNMIICKSQKKMLYLKQLQSNQLSMLELFQNTRKHDCYIVPNINTTPWKLERNLELKIKNISYEPESKF